MTRPAPAVLAAVTVVAAFLSIVAAGPFTPKGTQPPLASTPYPPSACQSCHSGLDQGHYVRPFDRWAGSMMANAARDPLFWAALDVANHDIPGVGDLCLRCHTPVAWLEGRSEPPFGSPDGCGLDGAIDQTDSDFEGVQCTLCHQMMVNPAPPPGEDPFYLENAQFWVDDESCDNGFEPCRRGPYAYLDGEATPPHSWVYSPYHVSADICGTCHNVTHPAATLVDDNGVDTGVPMPVERTFMEWQQSTFSQPGPGYRSCQNCHMPDATHDPASPCVFEQNNRSGDMPIHHFAGGNAWLPEVLAAEYPALDRADSFAAATAEAVTMLQAAAIVAVGAPAAGLVGAPLELAVTVTNLTGHKLPTGYPEGRRLWLEVVASRPGGRPYWSSGRWDAATGELADDPQLTVYEVKPGIWNRNGTGSCDTTDELGAPIFHFVLNDCIALDNRIPPLGFTGGASLETRPVGVTYPETSPGSGVTVNYATAAYTVPAAPASADAVTVTATLYYQTTSREYVKFLRDQAVANAFPDDCIPRLGSGAPTMSRGEILYDLWQNHGRSAPVAMASATVTVELALFQDGFEAGTTTAWSQTKP